MKTQFFRIVRRITASALWKLHFFFENASLMSRRRYTHVRWVALAWTTYGEFYVSVKCVLVSLFLASSSCAFFCFANVVHLSPYGLLCIFFLLVDTRHRQCHFDISWIPNRRHSYETPRIKDGSWNFLARSSCSANDPELPVGNSLGIGTQT